MVGNSVNLLIILPHMCGKNLPSKNDAICYKEMELRCIERHSVAVIELLHKSKTVMTGKNSHDV